jgi:archaellum component FlaF (FlaF/FlaG flagellin family)
MRYIVLSAFLIVLNLLYSAYAIKFSKEYVQKTTELKKESERNLLLKVKYANLINYTKAKKWSVERGFVPVDWEKVGFVD